MSSAATLEQPVAPTQCEPESLAPLLRRIQRCLDEAQLAGEPVALLLVHIGAIDRIDATHGFDAGDKVALEISRKLQHHVRKRDVVETISRGQFACILRPAPSEGIVILAANRMISLVNEPMRFGASVMRADPAIGIAMTAPRIHAAGDLLQRAKLAAHTARSRTDRVALHAEDDSALRAGSVEYEDRLCDAIDQNALTLCFQPQVDVRSGRLLGAESLLRWTDPVLGPVPPNVAVQVAESSGLIDRLTMWVIASAIKQTAEFQKALGQDFRTGINVSPSNLREVDLPFHVDRALRTWGVDGGSVVIEITETAVMTDHATVNDALRQLKSQAVELSVDDFGTGYSSMYYLAELPLDELKIDLMFVKDMLEVPHHAKIVRSLVDLGHSLDLRVVAEGVETAEVLAALARLGCDVAQGYYLAKPMRPEDLVSRFASGSAQWTPSAA